MENKNIKSELDKLRETAMFPLVGGFGPPNFKINESIDQNLASSFYDKIKTTIIDFEKDLNNDEEIGVKLISFGDIIIHIDDVGYWNPSLIYFFGRQTIDGRENNVQLVQHINQISFLLIKVSRTDQNRERIGYKLSKN